MARQPGAEQILRAWIDTLNAVADLQHAIVEEAMDLTMLDDWEWLEPFRAIVFETRKMFPDQIEGAHDLQRVATERLAALREEAKHRKA